MRKKAPHPKQDFEPGAQIKMHAGEIDIDLPLVQRLLAEQFPHLAKEPITIVRSTGTVNAIFRIGGSFYARLPRVTDWADGIDREWTWLPKLTPHISLEIPRPLARGKPADGYPYPWAIYHWIEGELYQDDRLRDECQTAIDLASFIMELRSVDMQGAPRGGRRPLIELDGITRSAIESCRGMIDTDAATAAWRRALQTPPWDGKPVWLHGDLLKTNLLVRDGRLCAVIDFGGVGIGDPAMDVVPAWSVFSPAARGKFRQALHVDEATWSRARCYALHQALLIIPYYPETNPEFVTMAKRTVHEILSDKL